MKMILIALVVVGGVSISGGAIAKGIKIQIGPDYRALLERQEEALAHAKIGNGPIYANQAQNAKRLVEGGPKGFSARGAKITWDSQVNFFAKEHAGVEVDFNHGAGIRFWLLKGKMQK